MKKWIRRIIDFSYDSADQHISAFVGQSTFFIFLSFFPLINLIFVFAPFLPFSEEQLTDLMLKVFPADLAKYVESMIKDIYSNGAPSFTIISVVVGLWASAKGLMAIRNGLNEIYHSREKKNYFVYIGRVNDVKGIRTLCKAAVAFPHKLIVIGDGELLPVLRDQYKGITNIEFKGQMILG